MTPITPRQFRLDPELLPVFNFPNRKLEAAAVRLFAFPWQSHDTFPDCLALSTAGLRCAGVSDHSFRKLVDLGLFQRYGHFSPGSCVPYRPHELFYEQLKYQVENPFPIIWNDTGKVMGRPQDRPNRIVQPHPNFATTDFGANNAWRDGLMAYVNSPSCGRGNLPVRYRSLETGRLHTYGPTSLQNLKKEMRWSFFGGRFEYDVSNSHYNFLNFLVPNLPSVRLYCQETNAVRAMLAKELNMDSDNAKKLLLQTLYGTRGDSADSAAAKDVGADRALAFWNHPFVVRIRTEIQQAKNQLNLTFKGLSQLIQAEEAKHLWAVTEGFDCELFLFDGFISPQEIDVAELNSRSNEQGINLIWSVKKLNGDGTFT